MLIHKCTTSEKNTHAYHIKMHARNHPWDVKSWPAAGLWNKSQRGCHMERPVQRASHQVTYWNAIIACRYLRLLQLQTQRLNENRATHSPQPGMHEDTCSSKLVAWVPSPSTQFPPVLPDGWGSKPTHSTVSEYSIAQITLRAHCVHKLCLNCFTPALLPEHMNLPPIKMSWDSLTLIILVRPLERHYRSLCHTLVITYWPDFLLPLDWVRRQRNGWGVEGWLALDQEEKWKENLVSQGMMVGQGLVTDANNPEVMTEIKWNPEDKLCIRGL